MTNRGERLSAVDAKRFLELRTTRDNRKTKANWRRFRGKLQKMFCLRAEMKTNRSEINLKKQYLRDTFSSFANQTRGEEFSVNICLCLKQFSLTCWVDFEMKL
jgi:hypothetical protein